MISRGVFEELDWTDMIESLVTKEDQPTKEESYYYSPVEKDRLRAFSGMTRIIQTCRQGIEEGQRMAAFDQSKKVIFELTTQHLKIWSRRAFTIYEREFKPHRHLKAAADEIIRWDKAGQGRGGPKER